MELSDLRSRCHLHTHGPECPGISCDHERVPGRTQLRPGRRREVSGDYQWTEARQSEMFRSVERTGNGNITLSEDQLHVLDKFGAWIQVEYSCHYETRTGELERVEVWPIERMLRSFSAESRNSLLI